MNRRKQTAFKLAMAATIAIVGANWHVAPARAQSNDDYFVSAFGDPMDFSNPQDLVTNTDEAMFVGGTNKSIADGQLHFDASGPVQFDPIWAGFPTGIPHGREGGRVPVDTAVYKTLTIRYSAPAGAPLGLRWFSCLKQGADCQGGQAWVASGGWETKTLTLGDDGTVPGLPLNWTGKILGLRIVGTFSGHMDVDYMRLTPAGGGTSEIAGGPTIDITPSDKLDYATASGNPWDMDSMGDIAQVVALKPGYSVANNKFTGCSLGTDTTQFPGLVYNLPSGPIDTGRFKTLTFEYSYDGPFSARPVPGGGKFARVFWYSPDGKRHPTMAIHLYPNENIVQVRLDDPAASFIGIEPGKGVATGAPWAGLATQFRINPNDTHDSACFTMGRVWLTADEPAGAKLTPVAAGKGASTKTTDKGTTKTTKTTKVPAKKGTPKPKK